MPASIVSKLTCKAQVQRLLEIAYTDRSSLPLEKESFDVNLLIKEAINDLQPLIEQKRRNHSHQVFHPPDPGESG